MESIFTKDNIILNASFSDKWEAIKSSGEILYNNGYVEASYIDDMVERQNIASVYIGNGVAIPHGISSSVENVLKSGISFIQVPKGVSFGDEKAYILIGIAGKDGSHVELLGNIAMILMDEKNLKKLKTSQDVEEIVDILSDFNF